MLESSEENQMQCVACSKELPIAAKFCKFCGANQIQKKQVEPLVSTEKVVTQPAAKVSMAVERTVNTQPIHHRQSKSVLSIILLIILVIVVVASGVAGSWFWKNKQEAEAKITELEKKVEDEVQVRQKFEAELNAIKKAAEDAEIAAKGEPTIEATSGIAVQAIQPTKQAQALTYSHGTYTGEVANGKANGQGKFTSSSTGTTYTGNFIDDNFDGDGVMRWTDGTKYVGKWQNNIGMQGAMTYPDGRVASGTVKNAKFTESIGILSVTNIDKSVVNKCDALAGSPTDPQKKSSGVEFERIDSNLAMSSCQQAVKIEPNNSRLWYQLGRALEKANNLIEAVSAYEKSAQLGSASAYNNLGELYRDGKGFFKNKSKATELFQKSAELGSIEGRDNLAKINRSK